jgi:hypothetical protein
MLHGAGCELGIAPSHEDARNTLRSVPLVSNGVRNLSGSRIEALHSMQRNAAVIGARRRASGRQVRLGEISHSVRNDSCAVGK